MTVKSVESVLTRRALRIAQGGEAPVYLFSLAAREILQVAEISRVGRGDHSELIGYQRPEVRQHVKEITDYLDGDSVLFPNPIIIALPSTVKWTSSRGPNVSDGISTSGMIEIPLGGTKPGWIVDGQQRALALSRARRTDFPVPVNAFITDSVDVQRDQFLRINNTKPLPRGLVTELLPDVSSPLPPRLSLRQLPSKLCDLLNTKEDSPFQGLIKRASTSERDRKVAVVTDTSLVAAFQENLQLGCLFQYRNLSSGETDSIRIWLTLVTYWTAVRDTFPEAWGKSPAKSRLMHGAGIRAMGRLMDRVMSVIDPSQPEVAEAVRKDLALLSPYCHWTDGKWEELRMNWDEVQNVPRHINELSNYLIRTYHNVRITG